jgi:hypothetical protein
VPRYGELAGIAPIQFTVTENNLEPFPVGCNDYLTVTIDASPDQAVNSGDTLDYILSPYVKDLYYSC